jgi:phosphatidylglycerophosphate synthase
MDELKMESPAGTGARTVPERARHGLARLPDALTRARLLALPVLWVLALLRLPQALAICAAAAALTDALDGFAARRLHVASRQGGARDSFADHLLSVSLVAWLALLRPEFVREQRVPLLLWGTLALGVLLVALARYGLPVNLHLYSAKAAGFAGWTFALILLFTGTYSRALFTAVLVLLTLAAVEALLVVLGGRADAPRRSLFSRGRD